MLLMKFTRYRFDSGMLGHGGKMAAEKRRTALLMYVLAGLCLAGVVQAEPEEETPAGRQQTGLGNVLDPSTLLPDTCSHRYASVFMLDRLPVEQNGFRTADDALAGLLGEWTIRDYHALGCSLVKVPLLPPEERLAFVLESLCERGFLSKD